MTSPTIQFYQTAPFRGYLDVNVPEVSNPWLPPFLLKGINWLLRKFFCATGSMPPTIEVRTMDFSDVSRAICEQEDLIAMIYDQKVDTILMGPRQLRQLERQCQPMVFKTSIKLGGWRGIQYFGLNIHLVPWLDGVVALPKEFSNLSLQ